MPKYLIGARGHDYGCSDAQTLFSRLKKDGYQTTQLAFIKAIEGVHSYEDVTPSLVKQTKDTANKAGIELSVLGTYVELSDLKDQSHKLQVQKFISQIPVCKALGARCIASETTSMTKQPVGATKKEAQARLIRALEQILPVAQQEDVIVALEPVWHHALDTTETVKMLIDTMQSKHLKFIFDPANLLSKEWIDRQDELFAHAMEVWGEHVMAVHFKGVRYDEQQIRKPCALGLSVVDYAAAFRAMSSLPQAKLPVLREEAVPAIAEQDITYMQSFF